MLEWRVIGSKLNLRMDIGGPDALNIALQSRWYFDSVKTPLWQLLFCRASEPENRFPLFLEALQISADIKHGSGRTCGFQPRPVGAVDPGDGTAWRDNTCGPIFPIIGDGAVGH